MALRPQLQIHIAVHWQTSQTNPSLTIYKRPVTTNMQEPNSLNITFFFFFSSIQHRHHAAHLSFGHPPHHHHRRHRGPHRCWGLRPRCPQMSWHQIPLAGRRLRIQVGWRMSESMQERSGWEGVLRGECEQVWDAVDCGVLGCVVNMFLGMRLARAVLGDGRPASVYATGRWQRCVFEESCCVFYSLTWWM